MTLLLLATLAFAKEDPVRYKPGTGLVLEAKDSPFRLIIETFVQPAVTGQVEQGEKPEFDFVLRRARLDIEARISQHLRARLQLAADDGQLRVRDATANIYVGKLLRFRGGLVRMPGGLDRELSGRRMAFLYRSPVARFFPNRLLGFDAKVTAGPFFAHVGVGESADVNPLAPTFHVDVAARVGAVGDRYLASVRGLARPRPGGSTGASIDASWGPDLIDPLPWTGTGWTVGADAAGRIGPVRMAVDGALSREGVTDGTTSGHTLHYAVTALLGVSPITKKRADADALWQAEDGLELTARGVFARSQPAPGAGLGASYGEGGLSIGYAPIPALHVFAEGSVGLLMEDEDEARLGGGAAMWLVVGP